MSLILIPRRPFAWAAVLLITSAAFCGYTFYRFFSTEHRLRHTYQVQLSIADIERDLTRAGRARSAFVDSLDPRNQKDFLKDFSNARTTLEREVADLRRLVSDNPEQIARVDTLRDLVENQLRVLENSIALKQSAESTLASETQLTSEAVRWAFETAALTGAMTRAENALIEQRSSLTTNLFGIAMLAILLTFGASAYLFWLSDRILAAQLQQRQAAQDSAQLLSTALMRTQDEERRRFSRELHDSLGQTLAAMKMLADRLVSKWPQEPTLAELSAALGDAVKETRTLSQLLHPPLLDEVGFLSAAQWFIDEFSKRTGISVDFNCDATLDSLPKNIELTLFRVLQESLTNVHRHSGSAKATVNLSEKTDRVTLTVRDFGVGIPSDKLKRFESNGSGVGVGLAGMRNRAREQGGKLSVTSDVSGTAVTVELATNHAINMHSPPPKDFARAVGH